MIAKGNVLIGLDTRFGADWPGQRCRAKTRRGTACQRPANKKNGRCRLHGGASSGPRTEQGRAKIAAANTTPLALNLNKPLAEHHRELGGCCCGPHVNRNMYLVPIH